MARKNDPVRKHSDARGADGRERTPFAKLLALATLGKLDKLDRDLAEAFKPDIERRKKQRRE